ncbi:MAG TPA: hypothetical protein VMD91_09850 [Candidatus Sulfotelmatobacter sp.]|nr:hypothetical protein [Candidatus Sulfotelmatobacter sp.]
MDSRQPCACGHEADLHDAFGCAAYLGAFPETAESTRRCGCLRAYARDEPAVLLTPTTASAEGD